jgi:hypothetical protein
MVQRRPTTTTALRRRLARSIAAAAVPPRAFGLGWLSRLPPRAVSLSCR